MALFGSKKVKKEESTAPVAVAKKVGPMPLATDHNLASVLVKARISEKAFMQNENNVYVFEVKRTATKFAVRDAVKALYNVTPVKVNIVNKKPAKRTKGFQGKTVHDKGMKKAYVYLKKGETITLV